MSVSPTIGKSLRDDGSSSSATTPRVALALVVVVSSDGLVSYRWVARARVSENSHHCQCKVLNKCRKTKTLKSKSDTTIVNFLQAYISNSFFLLETNEVFAPVFLGMENLMLLPRLGSLRLAGELKTSMVSPNMDSF